MKGQIQSSGRRSLVQTARLGLLFLVPVGLYACLTPYGPDTCKDGFVWREAFDGDHVCVLPQSRQRARDDNALAASRVSGPDTCMTGFVWREAAPVDHVCVSPQTRQQTLDENARADARRVLPP